MARENRDTHKTDFTVAVDAARGISTGISAPDRARTITVLPDALPRLLDAQRPGYWHFEVAHRIVLERELDCTACHTPEWPTAAATSSAQRQVQLNACSTCH